MAETEVLVVGAGPTGLVLALWLTRLGVRVRIVDKTAGPGTTSRAVVVHARTLEFYRQIGLADAAVERGLRFAAANLWVGGRKVARAAFGAFGAGLSPFPYALILPQDEHEPLLIEHLARAGVAVERRTELLGFRDDGARVLARLKRPDGAEEACAASHLAGCDGARSTVRAVLGTGFPGGTYGRVFYVADARAAGPAVNGELNVALDEADFLAVFPLKGRGRARFIGAVRPGAEAPGTTPTWDSVGPRILDRMRVEVFGVNWFSTYRVHHRVAGRFRAGRVFLLGDAAHVHSPVGGQGMNTGIGDAVHLAWKLAAVLRGRAGPGLLDTYEPERIAFARRLVATTDRAFALVTNPGRLARRVRVDVVPRLLPALVGLGPVRRALFRAVSQTAVSYRGLGLGAGRAGRVRGGDRLPWVRFDGAGFDGAGDNHAALDAPEWQVHVYGACAPGVRRACEERGLALHVAPWRPATRRAGLRRDAAYLVRPDGHVALADPAASPARLEAFCDRWKLRPDETAAVSAPPVGAAPRDADPAPGRA